MLCLTTVNQSITIKLGGVPSAQLPCVMCYADITAAGMSAGGNDTTTNSTTRVTIVAAPGAGVSRQLKWLSVVNIANATQTVTLELKDSATYRIISVQALAVGDNLCYTSPRGFFVLDSNGYEKGSTILVAHASQHNAGGADPLAIDAAATTGSLRTLGTAGTSALAGNDIRLLTAGAWPNSTVAGAHHAEVGFSGNYSSVTLIAQRAYFVYIGRITTALTTGGYVGFLLTGYGVGTETFEGGLFSTTTPPSCASKSLTKIASSSSFASMLTPTGLTARRNTVTFGTVDLQPGMYIWVGVRANFGTTQPSLAAFGSDFDHGHVLMLNSAGTFASSVGYTASVASDTLAVGLLPALNWQTA